MLVISPRRGSSRTQIGSEAARLADVPQGHDGAGRVRRHEGDEGRVEDEGPDTHGPRGDSRPIEGPAPDGGDRGRAVLDDTLPDVCGRTRRDGSAPRPGIPTRDTGDIEARAAQRQTADAAVLGDGAGGAQRDHEADDEARLRRGGLHPRRRWRERRGGRGGYLADPRPREAIPRRHPIRGTVRVVGGTRREGGRDGRLRREQRARRWDR
jgi:hypothetical protein